MTITHAFFDVLSSTIAMTIAMSPIDMLDAADRAAKVGDAKVGDPDVKAHSYNTPARTSIPPMPGAYPYTRRHREQSWRTRRRDEGHLRQHLGSSLDHLDALQKRNEGAARRIERLRKLAEQLRMEEIQLEEENRRAEQQRLARAQAERERRERMEREAQEHERLRKEMEEREQREKLERERAQWEDGQRRRNAEVLRQSFKRYNAKWAELRAGVNIRRLLWAEELPWPVHDIQILASISFETETARKAVKAFILHADRPGSEGRAARQRIRAELLRWHPDKFRNQVLPKVQAHQREDTFQLAQQIAGFLNDIASEL